MAAYCNCGDLADFRVTSPASAEPQDLCGRCATLELAPHATGHRVENVQEDEEP